MLRIVALVDDLMFLSRIREAARASGADVVGVRSAEALLDACRTEPPAAVMMDLDSERLRAVEAVAALRASAEGGAVPVYGFYNHAYVERARAARDAGCTRVLTRGAFVKELPELLQSAG
jgi:CheY-like chemotaxis protein